MKRYFTVKKIGVVLTALTLTGIMLLTAKVSSSKYTPTQATTPTVVNKTQALQVERAINDGELVRLSLKNNYNKNIKGYMVSSGNIKMQEDFIYSERVITPGEVYPLEMPAPQPGSAISLLAVIFEDRSHDGDAQAIAEIMNRRLGEKIQLQRILPLLEKASTSQDESALSTLRSQIESLSEQPDNGLPQSLSTGLHNGKEDALQLLKQIEEKREKDCKISRQHELNNARERLAEKVYKL